MLSTNLGYCKSDGGSVTQIRVGVISFLQNCLKRTNGQLVGGRGHSIGSYVHSRGVMNKRDQSDTGSTDGP